MRYNGARFPGLFHVMTLPAPIRHSFLSSALTVVCAASAAPAPSQLAARDELHAGVRGRRARIRFIVIHVSEGSFLGTVELATQPARARVDELRRRPHRQDAGARAEAGRRLARRQLGRQPESVGIEHVGLPTARRLHERGVPRVRAPRSLSRGTLSSRSTASHIIGHCQVPDPSDPLLGGGIDRHSDPGPYWNWAPFHAARASASRTRSKCL